MSSDREMQNKVIAALSQEIRTALAYSQLKDADQIRAITDDLVSRLTNGPFLIEMCDLPEDGSWYRCDLYDRPIDPEAEKVLAEIDLLDRRPAPTHH